MEGSYGFHGESCRDGGPHASNDRNLVSAILLVVGLLTRPVAFLAFLYLASLWMSEWGTAWIWELLVPVLASLALAVGRAGREWGVDAILARRSAVLPMVVTLSKHQVRVSVVIPTRNEAQSIGRVSS